MIYNGDAECGSAFMLIALFHAAYPLINLEIGMTEVKIKKRTSWPSQRRRRRRRPLFSAHKYWGGEKSKVQQQ